jgi:hypothetical protein
LRVFIGSSREARRSAELLARLLEREPGGAVESVEPWWGPTGFPPGETFMGSLFGLLKRTNAGLFLATGDDEVTHRGKAHHQVRDNVIFEYGMWAGRHGRFRTGLAVLGDPRLPTDLLGLNLLELQPSETDEGFLAANEHVLRRWIQGATESLDTDPPDPLLRNLPKLYQTIADVMRRLDPTRPPWANSFDRFGAELLDSIARIFHDPDTGISERLVSEMATTHLEDCWSIQAVDVLGPAAWIRPAAYRYLSLPARRYITFNMTGDGWQLSVSSHLGDAISNACKRARGAQGHHGLSLHESRTEFDNPRDFRWSVGTPRCEFSRILLWTEEELANPVAESIIAIHEAFHIPLFCMLVKPGDERREGDFVLFRRKDVDSGFHSDRIRGFRPESLTAGGRMPGGRSCAEMYRALLGDESLLMATDARYLVTGT